MWDAISNVLMSPNAIIVLAFIVVIVVLLSVLAKLGIIAIKVGGVRIGKNDSITHKIMNTQEEWASADCADMLADIKKDPKNKGMNLDKAQLTIDKVYERLVKIIMNNNITLEPTFIRIKQDQVWAEVCKINPEDKWSKLEEPIRDRTKKAIEQFYAIKQYYLK